MILDSNIQQVSHYPKKFGGSAVFKRARVCQDSCKNTLADFEVDFVFVSQCFNKFKNINYILGIRNFKFCKDFFLSVLIGHIKNEWPPSHSWRT